MYSFHKLICSSCYLNKSDIHLQKSPKAENNSAPLFHSLDGLATKAGPQLLKSAWDLWPSQTQAPVECALGGFLRMPRSCMLQCCKIPPTEAPASCSAATKSSCTTAGHCWHLDLDTWHAWARCRAAQGWLQHCCNTMSHIQALNLYTTLSLYTTLCLYKKSRELLLSLIQRLCSWRWPKRSACSAVCPSGACCGTLDVIIKIEVAPAVGTANKNLLGLEL